MSRTTVGNGAEAEILAMAVEKGIRLLGIMALPVVLFMVGIGPDKSMDAAEQVADAIGIAAGGRGWLWLPS